MDRRRHRHRPTRPLVLVVDDHDDTRELYVQSLGLFGFEAIGALDRLDPILPLSPGRAERHGFEYYRHGTLSLLAALDTRCGEVLGQTVPRHTSSAFVEFLGDIVTTPPKSRQIHVIADNLSTHKTQAVRTFLVEHPNVHLHFTPSIPPGSTRSNSGSPRSSGICSRAAFYVCRGSRPEDSSLHPPLQQDGETDPPTLRGLHNSQCLGSAATEVIDSTAERCPSG